MNYREVCEFLLTGYVDVTQCGILVFDGNENLGEIFPGLCDSPDSVKPGKYFYFFSDNGNHLYDLEECLSFTTDEVAEYEFPSKDGWYYLFKIEEITESTNI